MNVIDAAAEGAIGGLRLAAYVGALLVAFVALIALANDACGWLGGWFGAERSRCSGCSASRSRRSRSRWASRGRTPCRSAALLGVKTVLNEFIAYQQLGELMRAGALAPRSRGDRVLRALRLRELRLARDPARRARRPRPDAARRRRAPRAALDRRRARSPRFMTACVAGMLL